MTGLSKEIIERAQEAFQETFDRYGCVENAVHAALNALVEPDEKCNEPAEAMLEAERKMPCQK